MTTALISGWSMSALLPNADIRQRIEHVCFVPLADIATSSRDQLDPIFRVWVDHRPTTVVITPPFGTR